MRSARFVSAVGAVIAACPWASAQCEPEWLPGPTVPGIHGTAGAMIEWDPDGAGPEPFHLVVVTGEYSSVGSVPVGPFAEWDGSRWKDGFGWTSYPVAVTAMTYYNGQLIAGGSTAPHHYLYTGSLVFGLSGSSWASLRQGPHGDYVDSYAVVSAFAEFQGELVAAGRFDYAQGQTVNNIARWNGAQWQSLGGGITAPELGGVHALALYQGQLVAAGVFTGAGGQPVGNIARWNGVSWQPLGTGIVGGGTLDGARALIVHNLGLIAAGTFTGAGGQPASNIARWDGASWSSLGAGVDGLVNSLVGYNGSVIAGGDFANAGGQPANDIARWDGSAWSALGSGIGEPSEVDQVSHLHVYQGLVMAGGTFRSAGGAPARNLAAWNGATGQWSAVASGAGYPDGEIKALNVHDGEIVAAGQFFTPQNQVINVVRRAGAAWEPLGTGVVLYHPAVGVHTGTGLILANYRNDLILAGHLTHVGGVATSLIARWNGTAWSPLGPGLSGQYGYPVTALAVHDDGLIAGGLFTHAGAQAVNYIARWDGDTQTWSPLGGGVTAHIFGGPHISALTVHDGDLIASGSFSSIGGIAANRIARWDGASWAPMGGGLLYHPWNLAVYNGDLIAFLPTGEMSRWTGGSWQPLSMGVSAVPDALLVYRGELVLGRVNGFGGVARWNGTVLQPLGSGLGPWANPDVNALVSHNGELIVGGQFLTAGGAVSLGWARWGCACYADCNNNQALGIGDFACFQTQFVAGHPYADCNGDGVRTIADFSCFQTTFVAGCP